MNNKRVNGKRKRITSHKMYKLQGKTKLTAPKQVIIAIQSESEYGEPIVINGLKDFTTK